MKLEIVFQDGRREIFDNVASFSEIKEHSEPKARKAPEEGVLFEVNTQEIDQNLFEGEKTDKEQEKVRLLILRAFAEIKRYPEKYDSQFYTLIPVKYWEGCKSVSELKRYAINFGGVMADWVQQAMEMAQRISNGETWENVCNNADISSCYRAIIGESGGVQLVGGSLSFAYSIPASDIGGEEYCFNAIFDETVPLVVIKKK